VFDGARFFIFLVVLFRSHGSTAVAQDNPVQRKAGALQHHLCSGEPHHDIYPDTALHSVTVIHLTKRT